MKNKRALVILFIANAISNVAQGISMIAVPAFFLNNNQASLWTYSFGIIWILGLLWRLYAGALVDGFKRKDVFLGTNFFACLIVSSVAILGYIEPTMPVVLPMLVFATTLYSYFIHFPNLYAFVQEISEPKYYSMWTRYIEVAGQITRILAGFLGAKLMGGWYIESIDFYMMSWPIHEIFALNGITYLASFCLIFFIKYKKAKTQEIATERVMDVGDSLKVGFRYLKKNPIVFVFGLLASTVFICYTTVGFTVLPTYIGNYLVPNEPLVANEIYGFSEFSLGVGALLCAFMLKVAFRDMAIPKAIIILLITTTISFVTLAFTKNEYILYVMIMLLGFSDSGARIYRVLYVFNKVPNELIGRINSILNIPQTVISVIFIFIFGTAYFTSGENVNMTFGILAVYVVINIFIISAIYRKII